MCANCGPYSPCFRCSNRYDMGSRARQARAKYPINDVMPEHLDEALYKFLPADRTDDFYKFLHDKQNPPIVETWTAEYIHDHPREFLGRIVQTEDGVLGGILTDVNYAEHHAGQNYVFVMGGKASWLYPHRQFTCSSRSR